MVLTSDVGPCGAVLRWHMGELRWHAPTTRAELEPLLSQDGIRLHGGGTGLLRNRPASGTLVDLSLVGFSEISIASDTITIGSTATFASASRAIAAVQPGHIVALALSHAATPALRNRITIGGSVALFPPWSSIVGPLLATDGRVKLVGHDAGEVELSEYLATRDFRQGTAIEAVTCSCEADAFAYWFEFRRTRLTYPLFTVSVLTRLAGTEITGCRIVLTGTRGRYARPVHLEEEIVGSAADSVTIKPSQLETIIPDRQGFSSEYLTHVASVEVTRGIRKAADDMARPEEAGTSGSGGAP